MAIIKLDGGYNALPISYKRGNPIPLDTTAVWYDLESLQTYARTGVTAYVGQVLSLVSEVKDTEGVVIGYTSTAYIIADTNGTLEPIGTAPIGDEKSIVVAEDGTVSLAGIDALSFEQDVLDEEGQPTGEKEEVQFQPLMTKDGLVWVVPSKTTVEGLASLIDALTLRVKALEDDRVTESELADAIKDFATDAEVAAAVKVETDRAVAAEEALGKRIDAIDFVDETELATALAPYAKIADVNNSLASKADKEAYEGTVEALNTLKDRVDAFLTGTGASDALDSLQELINYINTHDDVEISGILGDIQTIENKLVLGTYLEGEETKEYATVKAYVEAAIEAIKIGDYAKASDLTDLANRVKTLEDKPFDTYATKSEVEAVNAKFADKANTADVVSNTAFEEFKTANTEAIGVARSGAVEDVSKVGYALAADVVSNDTFDTFKSDSTDAIATAKQEAIDAAGKAVTDAGYAVATEVAATYTTKDELTSHANLADEKYATKQFVGAIPTGYTESTVVAYVNKKAQEVLEAATGGSQESAGSVKLQLDNYKAANDPKVAALLNEVYGPIPEGGDAHDYTAASRIDNNAQAISLNAKSISDLALIVNGSDTTDGIAQKLAALETDVTVTVDGRLDSVEGTVAQQTKDIAANTAAITKINTETIPAVQQAITEGDQAILDKIGAVTEGKTVVDMINAVAGTIDFTPYATNEALAAEAEIARAAEKANADAIVVLTGYVDAENPGDTGKSIRAIATEEAKAEVAALVGEAPEALDTIHEIASWIKNDESGAAAMSAEIAEHSGILTGFGGEGQPSTVIAAITAAKQEAIAAIPALEVATAETLGGIKTSTADNGVSVDENGAASVTKVNVNTLTQTAGDILVLNGGGATL